MPDKLPRSDSNGHPVASSPDVADPLSEAEAVRELLGEAQARLGRLLTTLKLHRRQSRALRAAVGALRDLPTLLP